MTEKDVMLMMSKDTTVTILRRCQTIDYWFRKVGNKILEPMLRTKELPIPSQQNGQMEHCSPRSSFQ